MQRIATIAAQRVDQIRFESELLRSGFAAFPYLIMTDTRLSIGARMTYAFLLMYGWQSGSCFPGQTKLATEMGVSRPQVQRYLYELRDQGLIRIERADRRYHNTYVILDRRPTKLKRKMRRFPDGMHHP